jgi:uncharacterized protein with HEPN domain
MSDEVKKYLADISESIHAINEYLGPTRKFENYKANQQLQDAVERRLEIIGEATNRILKINSSIQIAKARRIVDMRNKVIHAYDAIDDVTIWAILINDLPVLQEEIKNLLHE